MDQLHVDVVANTYLVEIAQQFTNSDNYSLKLQLQKHPILIQLLALLNPCQYVGGSNPQDWVTRMRKVWSQKSSTGDSLMLEALQKRNFMDTFLRRHLSNQKQVSQKLTFISQSPSVACYACNQRLVVPKELLSKNPTLQTHCTVLLEHMCTTMSRCMLWFMSSLLFPWLQTTLLPTAITTTVAPQLFAMFQAF